MYKTVINDIHALDNKNRSKRFLWIRARSPHWYWRPKSYRRP